MRNAAVLLTILGLAVPAYAAVPVRALEPNDAPVQYTVTSWTNQDGLPGGRLKLLEDQAAQPR